MPIAIDATPPANLLAEAVTGDVDVEDADVVEANSEVGSGKLEALEALEALKALEALGADDTGTSVTVSVSVAVGRVGTLLDGRGTELVITPVVVSMSPVTGGTA